MLIHIIVLLLVFVIVASLVWYVITQLPLPPPIRNIVNIVFVVVCALILIGFLLQFTGVEMPK